MLAYVYSFNGARFFILFNGGKRKLNKKIQLTSFIGS